MGMYFFVEPLFRRIFGLIAVFGLSISYTVFAKEDAVGKYSDSEKCITETMLMAQFPQAWNPGQYFDREVLKEISGEVLFKGGRLYYSLFDPASLYLTIKEQVAVALNKSNLQINSVYVPGIRSTVLNSEIRQNIIDNISSGLDIVATQERTKFREAMTAFPEKLEGPSRLLGVLHELVSPLVDAEFLVKDRISQSTEVNRELIFFAQAVRNARKNRDSADHDAEIARLVFQFLAQDAKLYPDGLRGSLQNLDSTKEAIFLTKQFYAGFMPLAGGDYYPGDLSMEWSDSAAFFLQDLQKLIEAIHHFQNEELLKIQAAVKAYANAKGSQTFDLVKNPSIVSKYANRLLMSLSSIEITSASLISRAIRLYRTVHYQNKIEDLLTNKYHTRTVYNLFLYAEQEYFIDRGVISPASDLGKVQVTNFVEPGRH